MRFSTRAIHIGEEPDYTRNGEVVSAIHLSTTFARKDPEIPTGGYEYTRTGNPTRESLEKKLASLENGKYGLAFASGLAAETTVLLSLIKKGERIIASDDLYGGTKRLFSSVMSNFGVHYATEDIDMFDFKNLEKNDRIFWLETPSNPLMKVFDIKYIAEECHKRDMLLVVDNTFASPYFQNPLDLGADVVVHSTTKYINGHSDSLGGAVIVKDDEIYEKIKYNQNAAGAVMSPFDSYLVMRGIKTLEIRMQKHQENALSISRFLSENKKVREVLYPGLENNKYHNIAKKQMRGYGGMISFYLNKINVKAFLSRLKYFSLAESLGGVESLIEIPFYMTHASIPVEDRINLGITENLVRMSVGIENKEDLIDDISGALS